MSVHRKADLAARGDEDYLGISTRSAGKYVCALRHPGRRRVLVPIEETIRGFNMIMDGEVDDYPEASFNLVGSIDDAIEKGKKLLAQAQG